MIQEYSVERSVKEGKSRFNLVALLCVTTVAVIIGGIILHSSEIKDAIWIIRTEKSELITIPHLLATLHNNGPEPISLPTQGN